MVSVGHVTAVSLQKKIDWKRATKTGSTPHVHPLKGFGEGTVPSVKKQHFLPVGPRPLILQKFHFEAKNMFLSIYKLFSSLKMPKNCQETVLSGPKSEVLLIHKIMILKVFSLIENFFLIFFFALFHESNKTIQNVIKIQRFQAKKYKIW